MSTSLWSCRDELPGVDPEPLRKPCDGDKRHVAPAGLDLLQEAVPLKSMTWWLPRVGLAQCGQDGDSGLWACAGQGEHL